MKSQLSFAEWQANYFRVCRDVKCFFLVHFSSLGCSNSLDSKHFFLRLRPVWEYSTLERTLAACLPALVQHQHRGSLYLFPWFFFISPFQYIMDTNFYNEKNPKNFLAFKSFLLWVFKESLYWYPVMLLVSHSSSYAINVLYWLVAIKKESVWELWKSGARQSIKKVYFRLKLFMIKLFFSQTHGDRKNLNFMLGVKRRWKEI